MSSAILIPRTMEFYIYIKVKGKEIFKKFQNLNWQGWRQLAFRPNISLRSQFLIFILCAIFIYFSSFKEFWFNKNWLSNDIPRSSLLQSVFYRKEKRFFPRNSSLPKLTRTYSCNMKLVLEHLYFELWKIELNSRVNYLSSRNKKLQWIYLRNEFVVKFSCKNIE